MSLFATHCTAARSHECICMHAFTRVRVWECVHVCVIAGAFECECACGCECWCGGCKSARSECVCVCACVGVCVCMSVCVHACACMCVCCRVPACTHASVCVHVHNFLKVLDRYWCVCKTRACGNLWLGSDVEACDAASQALQGRPRRLRLLRRPPGRRNTWRCSIVVPGRKSNWNSAES